MRVNEPFQVGGGWMAKALPLFKWKRKQGMATFLRDLMDLRKTITLCASCERKMPRRWTEKYNYAFVRGFQVECAACDYCRLPDACNMYQAVDGKYHQDRVRMEQSVRETQEKDRALFLKDRRYFIGY